MPCLHKFFQHANHLNDALGLLPNWTVKTLIIGTFNPEHLWAPNNQAQYFYGRSKYFWDILPRFASANPITNANTAAQFEFLKKYKIGLTDLLIEISDANIGNQVDRWRIQSFKDTDIQLFNQFVWNTNNIIEYILSRKIETVYFTRLSGAGLFGTQINIIEAFCNANRITNHRLHTPSGQGLGIGTPRGNKLINVWYNNNGGNQFPFLSAAFNPNNFPWA